MPSQASTTKVEAEANQTFLNDTHVPLLESFLYALESHLDDLLIRLNKLCQIMDNIPAHEVERHARLDLLVTQCSLEVDWAISTFRVYKSMREQVRSLPAPEPAKKP